VTVRHIFKCYLSNVPGPKTLAFVVDDEEIIATTLALILQGSGFDAVAFTEPLKALVTAETGCPDFLITDAMMPGLNGVDLAVQLKAIYPQCRVLLFSGAISTSALLDDAREGPLGLTFSQSQFIQVSS